MAYSRILPVLSLPQRRPGSLTRENGRHSRYQVVSPVPPPSRSSPGGGYTVLPHNEVAAKNTVATEIITSARSEEFHVATIRLVEAGSPDAVSVPQHSRQGSTSSAEDLTVPNFVISRKTMSRRSFARLVGIGTRDVSSLAARDTGFIEPRPFSKIILAAQDTLNLVITSDAVHVVLMRDEEVPQTFIDCFPFLYGEIYRERVSLMNCTMCSAATGHMHVRDAEDSDSSVDVDPAAVASILPPDFELIALEVFLAFVVGLLTKSQDDLRLQAQGAQAAVKSKFTVSNLDRLSRGRKRAEELLADTQLIVKTVTQVLREDEDERHVRDGRLAADDVSLLSFRNCDAYNDMLREDSSSSESDSDLNDGVEAAPPPAPPATAVDNLLDDSFDIPSALRHGSEDVLAASVPLPPVKAFTSASFSDTHPRSAVCQDSILARAFSVSSASTTSTESAAEWPVPPDAIEDLLEAYLFRLEGLRVGYVEQRKILSQTSETVALLLDSARNDIMLVELIISILGLALGVGALLTGAFGMNLPSGLEAEPTRTFWLLFVGIILICSFTAIVGLLVTKRQRGAF